MEKFVNVLPHFFYIMQWQLRWSLSLHCSYEKWKRQSCHKVEIQGRFITVRTLRNERQAPTGTESEMMTWSSTVLPWKQQSTCILSKTASQIPLALTCQNKILLELIQCFRLQKIEWLQGNDTTGYNAPWWLTRTIWAAASWQELMEPGKKKRQW